MIKEFLVAFACTQNHGCPQTVNSYYASNPEVKYTIDKKQEQIKTSLGPEFVILASATTFAVRKRGVFRLTEHVNMEVPDRDSALIVYKISF